MSNPTIEGYSPTGESSFVHINSQTHPHTGLDLMVLPLMAVVLCVTGILMKRYARSGIDDR